MSTIRLRLLTSVATVVLAAGTASAQTAATCSFDEPSATLTIDVNGLAANITRTGPGQIRLNGVACIGATVTTTDMITVNGGALVDPVTITGSYLPGLTAEELGTSEIEWVFNLGDGNDNLRINFGGVPETVTFTAGGIDLANDGDEDMTTAGTDRVRIYTSTGNDIIDATAYIGGGTLLLWGLGGDDTITGSEQADTLYGQAGSDTLYGLGGGDRLIGGAGNDFYYGDAGNDRFMQDVSADGNDTFEGGIGTDTVDYAKRTIGVTVTIGNGLADDGQPEAELDSVDATVENVVGGAGSDVLVGSDAANVLTGNDGDDQLFGGRGPDELRGGLGADVLTGDNGNDDLFGDGGPDSIDGGSGNDNLFGGVGIDSITGGIGTDAIFGESGNDVIFNNDGLADSVDCGTGTADDAEVDPLDTLTGCEL